MKSHRTTPQTIIVVSFISALQVGSPTTREPRRLTTAVISASAQTMRMVGHHGGVVHTKTETPTAAAGSHVPSSPRVHTMPQTEKVLLLLCGIGELSGGYLAPVRHTGPTPGQTDVVPFGTRCAATPTHRCRRRRRRRCCCLSHHTALAMGALAMAADAPVAQSR